MVDAEMNDFKNILSACDMWNSLCKKQDSIEKTMFKVYRAIKMGKVFVNKDDIQFVYYDICITVNTDFFIKSIHRVREENIHKISYKTKRYFDQSHTFDKCRSRALCKYQKTIKNIKEV